MHARWYFDFISPFAYLQWPRIRALSAQVTFDYRPILFAAVLDQHGQKGPAEIAGKRTFTYRFVQWRADRLGIPLRFPPAHPFNPLAALRLCIAAGSTPAAITAIFDHIWRDGARADDAAALAEVARGLGVHDVEAAIAAPEVKAALKRNTEAALADGVFGVPSIVTRDEVFWGEDATEMFEAFLADPALFEGAEMQRLRDLPEGVRRKVAR